ncbi:DapH/DapD/GlmU-related protein [Sphingobacterium sp.]|uniref:acyltransferase n=1 Tax=Sphingobacterium sp. TaxID=341027 RepID=UPI0028B1230E|nr:DapH/DapD/GlmU-related protein [Sphingobacterium sp.]
MEPKFNLGKQSVVEANVHLGYEYLDSKNPTVIGENAYIHSGTVIYKDTIIGSHFTAGHNVTIRAKCNIGDRVVVLHNSTLEGNIKIGLGVKIMAHVYVPSQTIIGNMVFIGPGTTILNATFPMRKPGINPVIVGDHVVIGGGVTILPGVIIGNNSFIGAGSVITKNIPENSLVYGNPIVIKPLPKDFGVGNDPNQIFNGRDLWNNIEDNSWDIK